MPKSLRHSGHAITLAALAGRGWRDTLTQIGWPRSPLLTVAILVLAIAINAVPLPVTFGLPALELAVLLAGVVAVLFLAVLAYNVVAAGYRIQKDRADFSEAEIRAMMKSSTRFDSEELQKALSYYYGRAHTFIYYDLETKVSLSQNVRAVEMASDRDITIYFLQSLDPKSILVRPLGGTPALEIVEATSHKLKIRFLMGSAFIRLRIFGDVVPMIRSHDPDPEAAGMAGVAEAFGARNEAPQLFQ